MMPSPPAALIVQVEALNRAIAYGLISHEEAVSCLVELRDGGLTTTGARELLRRWAGCRECDMCGGCETHEHCLTDLGHIEWRMRFASPGEPVCGDVHDGRTCALVAGHATTWHQNPRDNGWETPP